MAILLSEAQAGRKIVSILGSILSYGIGTPHHPRCVEVIQLSWKLNIGEKKRGAKFRKIGKVFVLLCLLQL